MCRAVLKGTCVEHYWVCRWAGLDRGQPPQSIICVLALTWNQHAFCTAGKQQRIARDDYFSDR